MSLHRCADNVCVCAQSNDRTATAMKTKKKSACTRYSSCRSCSLGYALCVLARWIYTHTPRWRRWRYTVNTVHCTLARALKRLWRPKNRSFPLNDLQRIETWFIACCGFDSLIFLCSVSQLTHPQRIMPTLLFFPVIPIRIANFSNTHQHIWPTHTI